MALSEFAFQFRLVSVVFLGWLAWVVARRPYQEGPNRLLAAFLAVVATGFALEYFWFLTLGTGSWLNALARTLQNLLGALDPPILLAFALSFPKTRPALRSPLLWVPYGAFTLFFVVLALQPLLAPAGLPSQWTAEAPLLEFLHVNGTYVACFVLLGLAYGAERRRFLSRQVLFISLGVGFAALSRSAALFFSGGPVWAVQTDYPLQVVYGFLVMAAVLGASWLVLRAVAPGSRARLDRLHATLAALLALFFLVWGGLLALDRALGWDYALYQNYFSLRWLFVALIVGYGILRYQLFDLELQVQRAVRILVSVPLAVVLSMFVGDAALAQEWTELAARLVAFVTATGGAVFLYVAARRPASALIADAPPQMDRRRLEIYEATLEYALREQQWSQEQLRFLETLREVFDVSREEHDEVVARLRGAAQR